MPHLHIPSRIRWILSEGHYCHINITVFWFKLAQTYKTLDCSVPCSIPINSLDWKKNPILQHSPKAWWLAKMAYRLMVHARSINGSQHVLKAGDTKTCRNGRFFFPLLFKNVDIFWSQIWIFCIKLGGGRAGSFETLVFWFFLLSGSQLPTLVNRLKINSGRLQLARQGVWL